MTTLQRWKAKYVLKKSWRMRTNEIKYISRLKYVGTANKDTADEILRMLRDYSNMVESYTSAIAYKLKYSRYQWKDIDYFKFVGSYLKANMELNKKWTTIENRILKFTDR